MNPDKDIDDYFGNDIDDNLSDEDNNINEEDKIIEDIVLGIDLGTTNSCLSVWRNKRLEIIPDMNGNRTIPSIVSFTKTRTYVGIEAKNQSELNAENTIYEVKRLIGRKFSDEIIKNDLEFLTYKIKPDENDNIIIETEIKDITPEEISSKILMEIKHIAEDYLEQKVEKVVITVPAYFNDSQRQATKDACRICNLKCLRIINEPTAASLAYGLQKLSKERDTDMNIIVYDLGGGTLDVSLVNISNGLFQVLGSTGNTHLGGADFDNRLLSYCISEFKRKYRLIKLNNLSVLSLQKLKKSCENGKKLLSSTNNVKIIVNDFYDEKDLMINLSKEKFEEICRDLFILCLKPLEDIMISCDFNKDEIDEIILVGGATRIPKIRDNLELFLGKKPNSTINPDEVVAAGAAIQGYILSNNNDPFSENLVLLDVIPLSLGIETLGGVMNVLIPRNSIIPIKKKKKFTTDTDYETSVKIKIYEGERKMTKDNFLVGEFELSGLEPAPRGIAEIDVSFNVDVNGIISVTAQDLKNINNKKSLLITGNKGRLSQKEIDILIEEAKKSELKDKIERDKKKLFYEIEEICSNIKINIKNEEYKLIADDKDKIMNDIDDILKWLIEKKYDQRDKKEYFNIVRRLRKQYSTLVFRAKDNEDNIEAVNNSKIESTSIFNDDNDDIDKSCGVVIDIDNKEEVRELKKLRDDISELCYNVLDIINNDNFASKKDSESITNIKDLIDDTLLWIYVGEKISRVEYIQKINEINEICNNLQFEPDKRTELEELCYSLLGIISTGVFSGDGIDILKEKINLTLDWLLDIDIEIKEKKLSGDKIKDNFYDILENTLARKIDEINELCNNINGDITENEIEIKMTDKEDDQEGTSIFDL